MYGKIPTREIAAKLGVSSMRLGGLLSRMKLRGRIFHFKPYTQKELDFIRQNYQK